MARRKNFPLRLDPNLYRALKKWSEDELRSVNGQIEYLLRRAVKEAGRRLPSGSEAEPEGEAADKRKGRPGSASD